MISDEKLRETARRIARLSVEVESLRAELSAQASAWLEDDSRIGAMGFADTDIRKAVVHLDRASIGLFAALGAAQPTE